MKKIITITILAVAPVCVFAQNANDPYLFQYGDQTGTNYIPGSADFFGAGDQTNTNYVPGSVDPFVNGDQVGMPAPGSENFFNGNDVQTQPISGTVNTSSFKEFVDSVVGIISRTLIPLLILAGVAVFTWSLALFVLRSDNAAERAKARQYMIWSIIGLTLVFSVWGVSRVLRNTFFAGTTDSILPQFAEPGKDQQ